MSEELKPCPFCGSAPVMYRCMEVADNYEKDVTIRCDQCGISKTEEWRHEVEEAWNTRASEPEMAEALEGLLDALVVHKETPGTRAWSMTTAVPFAMDRARAALAKARGEG